MWKRACVETLVGHTEDAVTGELCLTADVRCYGAEGREGQWSETKLEARGQREQPF